MQDWTPAWQEGGNQHVSSMITCEGDSVLFSTSYAWWFHFSGVGPVMVKRLQNVTNFDAIVQGEFVQW